MGSAETQQLDRQKPRNQALTLRDEGGIRRLERKKKMRRKKEERERERERERIFD